MLRRVVFLLAGLIAAGPGLTQSAHAEPPVTYVEAPERIDPLAEAVAATIGASYDGLRGEDKTWFEPLMALYEARQGRAIWMTADGLKPAARQVAAEIRRAAEWGLDAGKFTLPDLDAAGEDQRARAAAEVSLSLAVLKYAAHAHGHRVDPSSLSKWLDQKPRPVLAGIVGQIADADDPAAALRALHPRHPQFERLRRAWLDLQKPAQEEADPVPRVILPSSGRILRPGIRHEDVELLRSRLRIKEAPAGEDVYDEALVEAVREFQRSAGLSVNGIVNAPVRRALNHEVKGSGKRNRIDDAKLLLVNMERWRWLPENLGEIHVWNNLPEFQTRVLRRGEVAFEERIIIGKPETQTPIFSDRMRYVVFKPEWGLPPSIKVKDLLPRLQDGDTDVLSRRGMKIVINGREKDPDDINWDRVDIRGVPIVQEAGSSNPLGQVKFMFPNKHDVYMHDTPSKHLFNSGQRTFSHGCIRVRNPKRLAELVFEIDRGWGSEEVKELLGRRADENKKVDLGRAIDVHNVYFTAVVDDDGSVRRFRDIYGHDTRIARALDGTPPEVIARDDPAVKHEESVKAGLPESTTRRRASASREPVSALDWGPSGRSRYRAPPRPRYSNRGSVRYYYYGGYN